jgi:hypothetical protein
LIEAVSGFIEDYLDRTILSTQYSRRFNGNGKTRFLLPNYPVTAVASLVVNGSTIPIMSEFPQSGFAFDEWGLHLVGFCFSRGIRNIDVIYTSGYATVPPAIEQACLELIALRYADRDRTGIQSKSLAGENVTYSAKDMPDSVKTALDGYRKVAPI